MGNIPQQKLIQESYYTSEAREILIGHSARHGFTKTLNRVVFVSYWK